MLQARWPLLAIVLLTWTVCRLVRRAVPATVDPASAHDVLLRDGNDYVVGFDASRIWVSSRNGEQACELRWDELTAAYALAIDGMPHGSGSWVLHGGADVIAEVPSNAEAAMALFGAMQLRLDRFGHAAAVDSAGMTHGFRQLWRKHPDQVLAATRDASRCRRHAAARSPGAVPMTESLLIDEKPPDASKLRAAIQTTVGKLIVARRP